MSTRARIITVGVAVAALSTLGAGIANAEPNWDVLAECESSGNWAANTGNGYYGGLQFSKSTWDAYKPAGAPAYAHQASKEQQIAAARETLKNQGYGAWPGCSASTNWENGGGTVSIDTAPDNRSVTAEAQTTTPVKTEASVKASDPFKVRTMNAGERETYVARGDSLSKIALIFNKGWQQIYDRNKDVIADPNLIYPGQQVIIPA